MSRAERRRMERETKGGSVPQGPVEEVVRAERFELIDKTGRVRGGMSVSPDGVAGLVLQDKAGKITAILAVEENGTAKLIINDMVVKFEKDSETPEQ